MGSGMIVKIVENEKIVITAVHVGDSEVDEEKISKGKLGIPPNYRFAISTKEVISCGQNHCAQLWLRTSWARKGIICSFGKIDSGFKGNLTLLGLNSSEDEVNIEIGNTFAQIVFEKL